MMQWKAWTETMNIGVLALGNITLNEDYMEMSIDICDMSENLKEEVKKGIEIEKVKFSEERKQDLENGIAYHPLKRNIVWSDKPVIMNYTYLWVRLEAGKAIRYSIEFGFTDADDDRMEAWGGSITVDLSAYENELKKAVLKVLVDNFF